MGSGKSAIGQATAQKLGLPFYDLDQLISDQQGCSIEQLFAEKGELGFRKIEHLVFMDFVNTQTDYVLSLGGGTPCYANNHLVLEYPNVYSFYLRTSIPELMRRLENETNHRPLLAEKTKDELQEYIAKHLFDRSYFYHKSKFAVSTDQKTIQEVADDIIGKLT